MISNHKNSLKTEIKIVFPLLLVFIFLWISPVMLRAQKKQKVFVERTDVQRYTKKIGKERLIGHVIIRQGNTRFYCDSAYLDDKSNSFEAFSNVHINVNDSVDVYGNRMHYDGNTRIAELFGDVKLLDKKTTLTTGHLVYNRNTKIAFYDSGGTIVSGDNNLVSRKGYYKTQIKTFYFRKDVVLTNPRSETYSDTLIYNTINETAYFQGPTVIRGKESTVYTEKGYYDTKSDFSKLTKKPRVMSSQQTISADSIYYNNQTTYGNAFGRVEINDTLHNVVIRGKLGSMWDNRGMSYITDSAMAITYDKKDSMYIHSDTLWMFFDKKKQAKKMLAYHNVRFFRDDMQGKCDSLAYNMYDSTIRLYTDPVMWSGKNQLTADSIHINVSGNRLDSLVMYNTAFIVSLDSLEGYNQIRGKDMIGYFRKNHLYKILVDGNAQTLYYIRDDNGSLIGIDLAESSSMVIRLEENKINSINYVSKVKEITYPEKKLPPEMKRLKGFNWQETLRPRDKNDIFLKPPGS